MRASLLAREDGSLAIKAGFKRAQLLPERLAAGIQFAENFNERLPRHSGAREARARNPFGVNGCGPMDSGSAPKRGASRNDLVR